MTEEPYGPPSIEAARIHKVYVYSGINHFLFGECLIRTNLPNIHCEYELQLTPESIRHRCQDLFPCHIHTGSFYSGPYGLLYFLWGQCAQDRFVDIILSIIAARVIYEKKKLHTFPKSLNFRHFSEGFLIHQPSIDLSSSLTFGKHEFSQWRLNSKQ